MRLKLFTALLGFLGMVAPAFAGEPPETVVLLHGLGRTRVSMMRVAAALERDGYRVLNLSYPSRRYSLESLATDWLPGRLHQAGLAGGNAPRIHFVTHSMGGIVVRLWLRERGVPRNLGRVVMLAPPNAGSEVADRLPTFGPFQWFTGVNGRRLGTGADALPRMLGPWPENAGQLGVIAGNRPINRLMAAGLPVPNDGKVSVASTHLRGESAHTIVPHSHTWIAWRRSTLTQVKAFLRHGTFLSGRSARDR